VIVIFAALMAAAPAFAQSLGGVWYWYDSPSCSVEVDGSGSVIAVTNEVGEREGAYQDGPFIVVPGWGDLVGEISPDQLVIHWYNDTYWTRPGAPQPQQPPPLDAPPPPTPGPYVGGSWWFNGPCAIEAGGNALAIRVTNEVGEQELAQQSGSLIFVPEWNGLVGQIADDGLSIAWSNGTTWTRTPPSSDAPLPDAPDGSDEGDPEFADDPEVPDLSLIIPDEDDAAGTRQAATFYIAQVKHNQTVRLTILVHDRFGQVVRNQIATAWVFAASGIGHNHPVTAAAPSIGRIETPISCNTGGDGNQCRVHFRSGPIGAVVFIAAALGFVAPVSGAGPLAAMVYVGNPLARLEDFPASSHYVLVGSTSLHPENHFCTVDFCNRMIRVADDYYARYGASLAFNDMSLARGGLFDINGDWKPPHKMHDKGTNVDIRANGKPNSIPPRGSAEARWLVSRITQIVGKVPQYDNATDADTIHLHVN
jgi:hypothetical protein